MKKILFALLAVTASAPAWAESAGTKLDLDYLTKGGFSQTPYQKIEDLFDRAAPMQLNQLPLATDSAVKNWNCVEALEGTTVEQLQVLGLVPLRAIAKVMVSPAKPGTPSEGPLFPGTPGTPERDQLFSFIVFAPTNGSFNPSPEAWGTVYVRQKLRLATSPELVESFLFDPNDAMSLVKQTFRAISGLIVYKQEEAEPKTQSQKFVFGYCYQR